MNSGEGTRRQDNPGDDTQDDAYGNTTEEQRETVRGEQGTSSGDPHDDTDPQQG